MTSFQENANNTVKVVTSEKVGQRFGSRAIKCLLF